MTMDARGGDNDQQALLEAMRDTPKGAITLAGIAVLLLLVGWFFVYFAIFVPRGSVG